MGALLATPWSRTRTRLPAWRALLTCRGQKLWQMRRALPAKNLVILGPVCLVRDAATFLDLERRGLIDAKGKPWANGCPLTAASEDVWRRQRRAIVRELPSALARSVACGEAAASRILAAAPGAADLRAVLEAEIAAWAVDLFAGSLDGRASKELLETLGPHWRCIRGRSPKEGGAAAARAHRAALAAAVADPRVAGVIGALRDAARRDDADESALRADEVVPNASNALVAAFETCLGLVLWTLAGLADRREARMRARDWCRTADAATARDERAALAAFKQAAAAGDDASVPQRFVLARCLEETLRVAPPVWTLARDFAGPRRFLKLDVLSVNSDDARPGAWDPLAPRKARPCASFGLGRRACPAGAAALQAAHAILAPLVAALDFRRRGPELADRAYLGPTLCVRGPVAFDVAPWPG